MHFLRILLLSAVLITALHATANDNKPRTDGFYRAQGSGDKVESARVFWIKFTGPTMLLEFYNTEGEKLMEYFKYSEYKFFPLSYTTSGNVITASDKGREYKVTVKGNELNVTSVKGDKLPAKFVFVPEQLAQNERKGISKLPNVATQQKDDAFVKSEKKQSKKEIKAAKKAAKREAKRAAKKK